MEEVGTSVHVIPVCYLHFGCLIHFHLLPFVKVEVVCLRRKLTGTLETRMRQILGMYRVAISPRLRQQTYLTMIC